MPMIAPPLVLKAGDEQRLEAVLRASTAPVSLVTRARIVLCAAQGLANAEIARRVGVSGPTVLTWRDRYRTGGLDALGDLPRSGPPVVHDELSVVAATLTAPPERLGVTHWSARLLGAELGISFATVARIWRKWNLQPWRTETFKFSTDPELEAKIRDVVAALPQPAGAGRRGQHRREVPDPGAGPDRADAPAAPRDAGPADPRLQALCRCRGYADSC
jgi:transposase